MQEIVASPEVFKSRARTEFARNICRQCVHVKSRGIVSFQSQMGKISGKFSWVPSGVFDRIF